MSGFEITWFNMYKIQMQRIYWKIIYTWKEMLTFQKNKSM